MFISKEGIYFKHNLNLNGNALEEYRHGYTFMWDNWIYKYTGHITRHDENARSCVLATSLA